MENLLELPAPKHLIERVETLARDIAYGIDIGYWGPKIGVMTSSNGEDWANWTSLQDGMQNFSKYLKDKWSNAQPSADLMLMFGYFTVFEVKQYQVDYLLSSNAFLLLQKPTTPPSIFISYKQDQSSALALLIEARLKLQDSNINIFIDKLLQPGDDWEQRLEQTVRQSRYFISLIGQGTLESETIQKELKWASAAGCIIIAICHNAYKIDASFPTELQGKQAIIIPQESAKHYESAISDLLNGMGYSTY